MIFPAPSEMCRSGQLPILCLLVNLALNVDLIMYRPNQNSYEGKSQKRILQGSIYPLITALIIDDGDLSKSQRFHLAVTTDGVTVIAARSNLLSNRKN